MEDKKRVQAVLTEKQLISLMNNTKWERLRKFVDTLPFPPAYQVKYVLADAPHPRNFEQAVWYWGDWTEGLRPFYQIEWIRVRPKFRAKSMEIIDETDLFKEILLQVKIPFVEKAESIYIYGYVPNMNVLEA